MIKRVDKLFFCVMIFLLILLPNISAISLKIEKISENEVIIYDLNKPVIFEFNITNLNGADNFKFYNLLGMKMTPIGTVFINSAETKTVRVELYPGEDFDIRGYYIFPIYIQDSNRDEIEKKLTVKIVELKDAFEVGSGYVDPESQSIDIYIYNKEFFDFGKIKARFSSPFFDFTKEFTLGPNEKKQFSVKLNKEDYKRLMAGFYTLNVDVEVEGKTTEVVGEIKFEEKQLSKTSKKEYGFFVNTNTITITNEGNTITTSNNVIKKNILSRLFTSFSPEPDITDREGFIVTYNWNKEIKPGEELNIIVKTNWFYPFLLILFIIIIVISAKKYSQTDLDLRKRVSFVRTKGGEFALKVSIVAKARNHIERVGIVDRLPNLVKIHERYGGEQPVRVNEKARRIEWEFDKLEEGETRILSYIIYSKVGVLGKFALPSATAIYERFGKVKEAVSNKAFFVSEQSQKIEEE